jgi:antirestriction protein ArdC
LSLHKSRSRRRGRQKIRENSKIRDRGGPGHPKHGLESGGVPPWRRPWRLGKNGGFPSNVVSKRPYRGVNPILLELACEKHGLSSKWWGTFRQWRGLGGQVMRRPENVPSGHWGTQIVFWSPVAKTVKNEEGEEEEDRFFIMRLYTIINVDQVEGQHLDHLRAAQAEATESVVIDYEPAEEAIAATDADIRYGGGKAFYSPSGDFIQVPPRATFESTDEFYSACFHELCHWTEHPTRLNWSRKEKENTYRLGELIAEIGACFVCRQLGVPASEDMTNHTAYLAHWLKAMRNDPRFIFTASAQASKAADFILSFSRLSEEEVQPETEEVLVG